MIELVRYHTWQRVRNGHNSSFRVALVKKGHKWMQVVAIDTTTEGGLRVWKVKATEEEYMQPLLRGTREYPMNRALTTFRKFAKEHGATKGAMKILKEASSEYKANKIAARKAAAEVTGSDA